MTVPLPILLSSSPPTQETMLLDALPSELLFHIASYLNCPTSIYHLSFSSLRLNQMVKWNRLRLPKHDCALTISLQEGATLWTFSIDRVHREWEKRLKNSFGQIIDTARLVFFGR
jgi:hypothetical protein